MIIDPIPLSGPSIGHREIELTTEAGGIGWNARSRQHVKIFETLTARQIGQRYALALNSPQAAAHLALLCLNVKPGDEVLLPEIADTFLAAAVAHLGAKPVFCDVDPVTLCLAPAAVAARITPRSRCVIPTHLFGQVCHMDPLLQLAEKHGMAVIENATQGIGAFYNGRPAGSMGAFSIFSLESDCPVTAGGGAVLLGSNDELMRKAAKLAGNGASASNPMVVDALAWNCLMSNLQAAVGVAQMERLPELLARKKEIFSWYQEELKYVDDVRLNPDVPGTDSSRLLTVLFLRNPEHGRPDFMKKLLANKVMCAPVFYPLSFMPPFRQENNPVAYGMGTRALVLPCGHNRTREEIAYIGSVLRQLLTDDTLSFVTPEPKGWLKYKSDTLEKLASFKKQAQRIPFTHQGKEYFLHTVTAKQAQSAAFIKEIATLRAAHPEAFLTNIPLTEEQLAGIMKKYGSESRDFLLFLIADKNRHWGNIALDTFDFQKRECKAESMMMHDDAPKGLAAAAALTLHDWCGKVLGLERLYNHIVGSNRKSRILNSAIGFTFLSNICLYKMAVPGGWIHRPMHIAGQDKTEETLVVSGKRLGGKIEKPEGEDQ
ncbi:MAG: DegT/DnrJ/EryC1/StrS family aminotransferase [Desulfovibrio sp.]|jgi:perosamine synthetase|nr:DegT/DnrJ/EryC1/StrS family aminotransferase [Desulfovibrio sp.]